MSRSLRRGPVVLAVTLAVALAVGGAACTSDDASSTVSSTTIAPGDDVTVPADGGSADGSDTDSSSTDSSVSDESSAAGDLTLSDDVDVSSVTCSNSGTIDDATGVAPPVDCGEGHDTETVSITGAADLDDCYRAIASGSDLVIVVDDEGAFDFEDDRVTGHAFGGYAGEYECSVTLAGPRTESLLDR